MQAAYTRDSACAVTPRIIDIIRSVIVAGRYIVIIMLLHHHDHIFGREPS